VSVTITECPVNYFQCGIQLKIFVNPILLNTNYFRVQLAFFNWSVKSVHQETLYQTRLRHIEVTTILNLDPVGQLLCAPKILAL